MEHLPYCEIVDDLSLCENRWTVHFRIHIESSGEIPSDTFWYATLPEDYPYGEISLFPAKKGGIEKTYWHQAYNAIGCPSAPWRLGNPCVSTILRFWGRKQYDVEPREVETRLVWHINRLYEWLLKADSGSLVGEGDPFEMPEYPGTSLMRSFGYFYGDEHSYEIISRAERKYGVARVRKLKGSEAWVLAAIEDRDKNLLLGQPDQEMDLEDETYAVWVELKDVPHLSPWQGIRTYGELRAILEESGIGFGDLIDRFSCVLRDGTQHLFLLGFPVQEFIGGKDRRQRWLACRLPTLAYGRIKGFRSRECSFTDYDLQKSLYNEAEIEWLYSRCWDESEVLCRGALPEEVRKLRFLIVGLGSVGSIMAELLARMGVKDFILIDDDMLEIGNLTRHTLTLSSLGNLKVEGVARRLRQIEPSVKVEVLSKCAELARRKNRDLVEAADVCMDCSGADGVLYNWSREPFRTEKLFVSVSVGLGAGELFVYGARSRTFPFEDFNTKIRPYIIKATEKYRGVRLPMTGIGCWNPTFPARADDIWLLTSVAVKEVEAFINGRWHGMRIFSLRNNGGTFDGVYRKS